MKKPLSNSAISLLLLLFGLNSCVSLSHVHNYASSSLESVKKFEVINYSFEQACLENCQEKKISEFILGSQDCNCKAEERADSVTFLIYNAIRGYFDGLSNLSNNTLTTYKTNALSKSITELNVTSVQIDKAQAEAYSNISNVLLRAFYDKYRKNKIREYLKAANEPILVLIKFLDFNLSANLTGKLNVQKLAIKDYYFDLTKDGTLSTFEKRKAVEEYYQRINKIETMQKELKTYAKALKKIGKGHQELVDNLDKINTDELKEQLTQDTNDIRDIISEFNKIAK